MVVESPKAIIYVTYKLPYLLIHGTHAKDDLLALRQGRLGRALLSIVLSNGLHKIVDGPHDGVCTRRKRLIPPTLVCSIDEQNQKAFLGQRNADSYTHMHIKKESMEEK